MNGHLTALEEAVLCLSWSSTCKSELLASLSTYDEAMQINSATLCSISMAATVQLEGFLGGFIHLFSLKGVCKSSD